MEPGSRGFRRDGERTVEDEWAADITVELPTDSGARAASIVVERHASSGASEGWFFTVRPS